MKNATSFRTVGFGIVAFASAFAAVSCGGSKGGSDDEDGGSSTGAQGGASGSAGTAGASATGGSAGTAGTPSGGAAGTAGTPPTGGTSGGGTAGTAGTAGAAAGGTAGTSTTCTANPTPTTCSGSSLNMHTPADGVVLDFAKYMNDTGNWGDSAVGDLTGGTSPYPTPTAITHTVVAGGLQMTTTLPPFVSGGPANYAGLVFWFGPCVNASAFTGVRFTVGGTMGGALLKAQVQTHLDYPVDTANNKGGCVFTNCDTKFAECKGPTATVTVPATAAETTLDWAAFTGGTPEAAVTPEGVVGLQFQIECQGSAECVVDMTLGNISFVSP